MKLLVFGKTGQVAQEIARHVPSKCNALFLGRESVDVADPAACAKAILTHRPDVVMNCTAWTAVDKAESHEAEAHAVNANAPSAMAEAASQLEIPFIHLSTDYVFGGAGSQPWKPGDQTNPINAYGRTKLAGERAVMASPGRSEIIRTSWVFSSHGTNFVKSMLRLATTHSTLRIVSDQIGGPTAAADLAKALITIAAAMHDGAAGGMHHYAGSPYISWSGFARRIFELARKDVTVQDIPSAEFPTAAMRPKNSRLDCTSLATAFDLRPADWQTGLAMVLKELGV